MSVEASADSKVAVSRAPAASAATRVIGPAYTTSATSAGALRIPAGTASSGRSSRIRSGRIANVPDRPMSASAVAPVNTLDVPTKSATNRFAGFS